MVHGSCIPENAESSAAEGVHRPGPPSGSTESVHRQCPHQSPRRSVQVHHQSPPGVQWEHPPSESTSESTRSPMGASTIRVYIRVHIRVHTRVHIKAHTTQSSQSQFFTESTAQQPSPSWPTTLQRTRKSDTLSSSQLRGLAAARNTIWGSEGGSPSTCTSRRDLDIWGQSLRRDTAHDLHLTPADLQTDVRPGLTSV